MGINAPLEKISIGLLFIKRKMWYTVFISEETRFMNTMKNMGQIIRKTRIERGLTQEQLAEILNVTTQAISRWECDVSQS